MMVALLFQAYGLATVVFSSLTLHGPSSTRAPTPVPEHPGPLDVSNQRVSILCFNRRIN